MKDDATPWWKRKASSGDVERKDAVLTGLVLVGAIYAWAFSPMQRYANPALVSGGAFIIVSGLLLNLIVPWRKGEVYVTALLAPFLAMLIGGTMLYLAGTEAVEKRRWNDRRCMIIQRALLRPTSQTRSDIADLFTAMDCRPQGGEPFDPNYQFNPKGPPPPKESTAAHIRLLENALANEVSVEAPDKATSSSTSAPVSQR